ncbi:RTA1-like protein [Trametes gibbosa]|nr:RTA1-like protein [Trametes gibbosa]KAI0828257.1 RTA1-like protein [Trametes gibbosa]
MISPRSGCLASPLVCAALTVLAAFVSSAQAADQTPPPWVFTDPKDDPFNPLQYIANNTLSAIAISLVLAVALVQSWMMWRFGGRCMLAMLIGEFTWAVGFGTRFGLHTQPDSRSIYIAYNLFIVLSPCAFIASSYMLLGRLARYLKSHEHLLIPPQRITVVFVVSDISTFLIQAAGALLSISKDVKTSKTGEHIFLAGLILQLASFGIFVILALRFLYRVKSRDSHVWAVDAEKPWHRDWRTLALVLIVSSVGIFIRCVYRVIELSQGYHGQLATTEAYFYGLDSLPLFIAVAVYTPFWPGRMIPTIDQLTMSDKPPSVAGTERSSAEAKV